MVPLCGFWWEVLPWMGSRRCVWVRLRSLWRGVPAERKGELRIRRMMQGARNIA